MSVERISELPPEERTKLRDTILEVVEEFEARSKNSEKPLSNYGVRTVQDVCERLGLDAPTVQAELTALRVEDEQMLRFSDDLLPGLELTQSGWDRLAELSADK